MAGEWVSLQEVWGPGARANGLFHKGLAENSHGKGIGASVNPTVRCGRGSVTPESVAECRCVRFRECLLFLSAR